VALLANNHPIGVVVSALLWRSPGAMNMERITDVLGNGRDYTTIMLVTANLRSFFKRKRSRNKEENESK
jgi:ABC-type uncharacterized transport system permease subunit